MSMLGKANNGWGHAVPIVVRTQFELTIQLHGHAPRTQSYTSTHAVAPACAPLLRWDRILSVRQPYVASPQGVVPKRRVKWPGDSRGNATDRVQLEPNHTHFILVDSRSAGGRDIADTRHFRFDVTCRLAGWAFKKASAKDQVPAVAFLINGGDVRGPNQLLSISWRRHPPL